MARILLILVTAFCFACSNSASDNQPSKSDSVRTKKAFSWSQEDEREFLSDCIDHAKDKHGEDTAYIYCNCVLRQVKEDFPNLDSASAILVDTVQAAKYTEACR
ncbi:MAG TPA: hypothetical protein VNR87_10985 [Flavisolibacter sp.]|nr:hypothetical protein [Flavisolibacter sp.]